MTLRQITSLTLAACVLTLAGCHKETEAERQMKKRNSIAETKRQNAIKFYKELAEKYPDMPEAKGALEKARALEAMPPLDKK